MMEIGHWRGLFPVISFGNPAWKKGGRPKHSEKRNGPFQGGFLPRKKGGHQRNLKRGEGKTCKGKFLGPQSKIFVSSRLRSIRMSKKKKSLYRGRDRPQAGSRKREGKAKLEESMGFVTQGRGRL